MVRIDGLRYPESRGDERNSLPDLKLAGNYCDAPSEINQVIENKAKIFPENR